MLKSASKNINYFGILLTLAGLALLFFFAGDFMVTVTTSPKTKNTGNFYPKSFKSKKDLTEEYILQDLQNAGNDFGSGGKSSTTTNNNNNDASASSFSTDGNNNNYKQKQYTPISSSGEHDHLKPSQKFPFDPIETTRRPIENGTFGLDPGRRLPCMIGGDHAQSFKQGDNRYMYKSFISRKDVLETHKDDGQYCFVAWEVSNVVFSLQYENGWCCVYVPALHVPSKKFVGADIHFHDYLIRGVVNTKEFPGWRTRLIKDTEPIRQVWWKHYSNNNNNNLNSSSSSSSMKKSVIIIKPGQKYIDDKIIQEASQLSDDLINKRKVIVPKKINNNNNDGSPSSAQQQQTTNKVETSTTTTTTTTTLPPPPSPTPAAPVEHKMMDVLYDGEHTPSTPSPPSQKPSSSSQQNANDNNNNNKVEETDLVDEIPPSVVRAVPGLRTPYLHILVTDLVGMMPAVSVAELMSYWGHFYSAGIQAMGPEKVTVVINKKNWGGVGAKLIDLFARYLPVPALYLNNNVTYFAKRFTFSPRAYQDVIEPCAFHFLYNWMVPTVVDRFRAAMKNGRKYDAKTGKEIGNYGGPPSPSQDPKEYTWSPHGNIEEIEKGVYLRTPVPPEQERPWWPKEFDEMIKNPPENLIILKTKTAAYSGRILEASPAFQKLAAENNFKFISDASPHDVRMFLINHAKRVITLWGGGGTIHSHLWGGGVKPRSEGIQTIDVILLIHPGYDWEFDGFYRTPLKSGGVDAMKTRKFTQGNLTTFLCPPNEHDKWSEAAFNFAYAWTKMIRIDDINKMKKEHMYISDEEKKTDLGPHCRDRLLEKIIGPRWTSKWEFKPPKD